MDELLLATADRYGVFLRSEARALGYDDKSVRAALGARRWVRVRHGAYCSYDTWVKQDAVGRHRIRARAVIRSLGDRVALSHVSSMIEQGCDVWGADLSRVHVTRLDGGAGRTEGDVVHHEGLCVAGDMVERDGFLLTPPARAVLEGATLMSVESGLVGADSALRLKLTDPEELATHFATMERWPRTQKVQLVVRLADGRAESVGESRSRFLFWSQGLPAPELQFPVYDALGVLIGYSDFAWPEHRLLGEFDGKVKYGRLLKPGQSPSDAVFGEKRREDLMREATRWGMCRIIWIDFDHQVATGNRFRRLLGLAA